MLMLILLFLPSLTDCIVEIGTQNEIFILTQTQPKYLAHHMSVDALNSEQFQYAVFKCLKVRSNGTSWRV